MNVININSSELSTTTENDPNLMKDVRNQVNPNLGFGLYYHTKNWFFGASTPKIFESSYDQTSLNIEQRHFFVNAGTILKAGSSLKLRHMVQAKFTEGAPLSLDAAITGIIQERVFIGAMYRLNAAGGIFVQYQLAPTLRIGVGSEIGLTEIRKYNDGTFELMLSYDVARSKTGIKSPRYF